MIRRHALGALLALAAGARPSTAPAQSRESRAIGYLSLEAAPDPYPTPEQWRLRSLSVLLRESGWDEGRNLAIVRLFAELDATHLEPLARTLVGQRVDVIVANGPEAALAAARVTKTIPIVCFNLVWPEEQRLIDSLARPGRNVTGVSLYPGVEASTKRMQLLRELAPSARRVSWLWPSDYEQTLAGGTFDMSPTFEPIAKSLGFELRLHPVRKAADIEAAFREVSAWHAHALMVSGEHASHSRQRIAQFALTQRLPTVCPSHEMVEAGGLFSYSVARGESRRLYARSFEYVDRILRGAQPADLPVERPNTYELTINIRTAAAIGITAPQGLLLRADTVIR